MPYSAISAPDALTTSYRGRRASDDHAEVLSPVQGIFPPQEYREVKRQFTSIINKKNAAEYRPDLMGLKDSQDCKVGRKNSRQGQKETRAVNAMCFGVLNRLAKM